MYLIYKHTLLTDGSDKGKSYIGLTSKSMEKRAGENGRRYLIKKDGRYSHEKFALAILKYGWAAFSHTVLESGIKTRAEANVREEH